MHGSLLSERHPAVSVEPDAIFVRDGGIWTSAGVSTGIDMALALIEEDFGHDLAMTVARILVVYLKRSGGQSQYSALLSAQLRSADDVFEKLELWIAEHLTKDLSVEALARRIHMSPRNFARVYLAKRGRTPAKTVRPSGWTRHDASWCSPEAASNPLLNVAVSTTKSICARRSSEVLASRPANIVGDSLRINRRKKGQFVENSGVLDRQLSNGVKQERLPNSLDVHHRLGVAVRWRRYDTYSLH